MSLISVNIPKQGFEVVRDAIAAIIKTELDNQKTLKTLSDNIKVFSGRSAGFNQSEQLMINVLVDAGTTERTFESGAHMAVVYFIDIYTSAKENSENIGGKVSSDKRDLYSGMIRYILNDNHYQTLGLPRGLIMSTAVTGFDNFESQNAQDAAFVKMARIAFSVRVNESYSLWQGIEINTIFTKVNLELTDLGYIYETVNE